MELLFKTISKAFQSLVQDLTPDEIERMMWSLKQEKEELVRYRAVIPQKMYLTTQVCRIDVLLYISGSQIMGRNPNMGHQRNCGGSHGHIGHRMELRYSIQCFILTSLKL